MIRKTTKTFFIVLIIGIALGLYLRDFFGYKPAQAKIVTIKSRNLEYQIETTAETVGEFYASVIPAPFGLELMAEREAGIQSWIPDPSTPAGRQVWDSRINEGMIFNLMSPVTVTIRDGGDEGRTITTTAQTVDDLLREQGIGMATTDRVTPAETNYLGEGMTVRIDRIVDLEVTETADIPFAVNIEHDPSSFYGREEVIVPGRPGQKEQKFLITYKNGIEMKRKLLSETIVIPPQAEQLRLGTRIEVELTEEGRASWYAYKACLCAAHPSYLKGRYVRVTAINSGKSVIVKINDRGPDQLIHPDRVIDLDSVAYKQLAPLGSGTIQVKAELLKLYE